MPEVMEVSQEHDVLAANAGGIVLQVDDPPPLKQRAAWRQVAYMDVVSLRHDLNELCDHQDRQAYDDIRRLLEKAVDGLGSRSLPWSWFQGTPQEQTFAALHEAQWRLLRIMNSEHLLARLPWLINFCRANLGKDDQRVRDAQEMVNRSANRQHHPQRLQINGHAPNWHTNFRLTEHERATVAAMVRDAYIHCDEQYAATRGMRNRILMLTAAAAAVLGLVIAAAAVWQWSLTPTTTVAVNGSVAKWSETPLPVGAAAFLAVALLGCLGAFLSGIRSVSRTGGTRNPYSLSWWQAWLKLPVGALTAIVGVFALQSRAFPAVPATSWTELLMWAVAFGAAQQAITRFIDSRVRGLVGNAPDKDDSGPAVSSPGRRSLGSPRPTVSVERTSQRAEDEE
jgi:hypothetical protein